MRKVIVDCDGGYDDAVALIILIKEHVEKRIKIEGITCVAGNTTIDNVVKNVFRTLGACDVVDIPVFKGAHSALLSVESSKKADNLRYHGQDGFGDVFKDEIDTSKLHTDHAVVALHRIITENPNEVSLICLGPLTNVALAIKIYPEILDLVKDTWIMGGNLSAVGNVSPQAEFNFYADPESVHIVLGSYTKPLWLMPWETCLRTTIPHEWRTNVLGQLPSKQCELSNKVEAGVYAKKIKGKFYTPCDAFIAAAFVDSSLILKETEFHADIELNGTRTRGQVVLDHLKVNKANVHMIEDFDFDRFQELVYKSYE